MSRDAIVAAALMAWENHPSLVGLSAGNNPESYPRVQFPHDTEFDRRGFCFGYGPGVGPSSHCGVTCWTIARRAGVDASLTYLMGRDFLREPYRKHIGLAITQLKRLGLQHDRWIEPRSPLHLPEAGDMPLIGHEGELRDTWGGEAHILTITGQEWVNVKGKTRVVYETIEGGQSDPKNGGAYTAILIKRQMPVHDAWGHLWLAHPDTTYQHSGIPRLGRRVQGWLQAGELPFLDG